MIKETEINKILPKFEKLLLKEFDKTTSDDNTSNFEIVLHNGFFVDFKVIREDLFAWVVESEKVSKSGGASGGIYYVNKKNPSRAVWD